MTRRRSIRIDHQDYLRALVTETLPYETPVIFASDGLYRQLKGRDAISDIHRRIIDAVVMGEGPHKKAKWTVPLRYKIRKDSREFRRLSLVHPHAQWLMKNFYERYETLILHSCAASPLSIRAPHKIASSFYIKGAWENLYQFKEGAVSLLSRDDMTRHSPSYFAYRGFDRLYKFFESRAFFSLEKRYSILRTLDVSKCFDSIYTHSLSWAIKDKEFTKENISIGSTFAQEFDAVMRFANHSETNGIVIGPEISRIFAEIIFQKIDLVAIGALEKNGLIRGRDYDIRRYVDDVFIFSNSELTADSIYKRYADVLMEFNLYANAAKSTTRERPFTTAKSRLITAASAATNEFLEKFLSQTEGSTSLQPRFVRSPWKLTRSFIDSVKALCAANDATYDDVASYLLSVFSERIKKLVNNEVDTEDEASQRDFLVTILVILDVQFFLYAVSPTVSASYRLCTSMLLAIRFAKRSLPEKFETLAQRIYELTFAHLTGGDNDDDFDVEALLSLETLNLLLAARELGPDYLLPSAVLEKIFERRHSLSYFQIMCCLWYTKSEPRYAVLRQKILDAALKILGDLEEVATDAEQAYLLLDLLSCPFVADADKRTLLSRTMKALQFAPPTGIEVDAFLADATKDHWHVNWSGVDLLNLLQRKELKQVY